MFVWNPNLTLESKLIPGVRYHFRRFSAGRRSDLEMLLAEYRDKVRDATIHYNETVEDVPENEQVLAARKRSIDLLRERVGKPVTDDLINLIETCAIDLMPTFKSAEYRRNQARMVAYNAEVQSLFARYEKAAKLRAYLTRIEGIETQDGKPLTVEQFIAEAPEEMSDEALMYIIQNGGLSEAELKNSQPASISSDPAQEAASTTTAGSAETTATTATATAADTTPTG